MKQIKVLQIALDKTRDTNKAVRQFLEKNQVKEAYDIEQYKRLDSSIDRSQIVNNVFGPFITQTGAPVFENTRQRNLVDISGGMHLKQPTTRASVEFGATQDSIMEYKVKEFVLDLFRKGFDEGQVENEVLQFFKNYDQSKEPSILKLQRRIDGIKKNSSKAKTY